MTTVNTQMATLMSQNNTPIDDDQDDLISIEEENDKSVTLPFTLPTNVDDTNIVDDDEELIAIDEKEIGS